MERKYFVFLRKNSIMIDSSYHYYFLLAFTVCASIVMLVLLYFAKSPWKRYIAFSLSILSAVIVFYLLKRDDDYEFEWEWVSSLVIVDAALFCGIGLNDIYSNNKKQVAKLDEKNEVINKPSLDDNSANVVIDNQIKDDVDNDVLYDEVDDENDNSNFDNVVSIYKDNNLGKIDDKEITDSLHQKDNEVKNKKDIIYDPEIKEKVYVVLEHLLKEKYTEKDIRLIMDSLEYFLKRPEDKNHYPKVKVSSTAFSHGRLENIFGVLLLLPLKREDCAIFMKEMFSTFCKTEYGTIQDKIKGKDTWNIRELDKKWEEIQSDNPNN